VATASIHGFMDNFTFESLALIDEKISDISNPSTKNNQIKTYVIEIGFDYIEDEDARRYFNNIATDLMLPEDQVDCLMYIGAWMLRNSEKYQQLISDLNGRLDSIDYTLPSHACRLCDDNTVPPPL
jgi:hypothetical protein